MIRQFGYTERVAPELFLQQHKVTRMGLPPFRIEVLTTISGLEFATAYARRIRALIDGVEVPVINLEDLKANKKASGRAKDLNDLENLP